MKSYSELHIPIPASAATTALVYRAEPSRLDAALILAHGAGADQRSPFIVTFAQALSAAGLDVVTFNFLYTEQRRRIPDRRPMLEACYRAVIDAARRELDNARDFLVIGGKSMGGRIATHVAAADPSLSVDALVLLGYPLHPPGRPAERRDAHLPEVGRPMLFVQGSRDAFGAPAEFGHLLGTLSPPPTFCVVEGGDHSFKVSSQDRARQAAVYDDVKKRILEWIRAAKRDRSGPR